MCRLSLGVGCFLLSVLFGACQSTPRTPEQEIRLGPSLTVPGDESISVWWHTVLESEAHRVDYGTTKALGRSKEVGLLTRYPHVRITELAPATRYYYRVVSDHSESEIYSFETPPRDGPRTLVVLADNQQGVRVFREYTVPLIRKIEPHALIHAGDLVADGIRYAHWERQLYGPGRELFRTTPWFPVRGNHDGGSRLAREMVPLPGNGRWYAKSFGPFRIVVLDSNTGYLPGSSQLEWLKAEVAGDRWRRAEFRIVAIHKPPFTSLWDSPRYDGEAVGRSILVPLLESHHTDLVLSGHTHGYEHGIRARSDGGVVHYLVAGGAGGALDTIRVFPWPHIAVSLSRYNVVILTRTARGLEARAVDPIDHEVLDRFSLSAMPPSRADRDREEETVTDGRSRSTPGRGSGQSSLSRW